MAVYGFIEQCNGLLALVSLKLEKLGLMGKQVAPVFNWYLNDLKKKLPNKSYSRDNRLHLLASSH